MIEFAAVKQELDRSAKPAALSNAEVVSLIAQSGCLVIAVVLAAVLGGIALDRLLNTRPVFTLFVVLGSTPVTLFILYRFAMRTLSKVPQPPVNAGKTFHVYDDES